MVQCGKSDIAQENGAGFPRRTVTLVICGLLIACAMPGVLRAAEAHAITVNAEASVVKIDNFTFSPATLTIAPGTSVTWTNDDDIPHTVVAKDKSFRSKPMDTGNQFSYTFATPGEYDYFCSLHPHMVGKIVVKSADAGGISH
jgi:plastocyanin